MPITSLTFLGFVAAVLVVYYLLPLHRQNWWLLLVSYGFYVTWSRQLAVVLLVATLFNFWLGRRLAQAPANRRAVWLWTGILVNLLTLLGFKYANFYVPALLTWLARWGVHTQAGGLNWLIPLGISYFTLQVIGYLLDIAKGRTQPAGSLRDFALYLAYFPKLVAGPIEHWRNMGPKLAQPRVVTNETLRQAFTLIILGLVRKLVIADTLAQVVPPTLLTNPTDFRVLHLWLWGIALVFQVYNDFAGYTNIVRGVSLLFGISLTENFQQPMFARNFVELWNRWHISLSHWLRDYVYFPLSRSLIKRFPSRRHPANVVLPPLLTMIASGLWHGVSWHLLLWGGLQGVAQIVENLPSLWYPVTPPQKWPRWRQWAGSLRVMALFLLIGIPFVAPLPATLSFWRGMLAWRHPGFSWNWAMMAANLSLFFVLSLGIDYAQLRHPQTQGFRHLAPRAQTALLTAALLLIMVAAFANTLSPFVYQGF